MLEKLAEHARVCVVHGMPGVGKTALAAEVANDLVVAERFEPYVVDFRGYTAGSNRVSTADGLGALLEAIGVGPEAIPWHHDSRLTTSARADLWRRCTAESPIVLVLDNVSSEVDVAELIPSNPLSYVIVTSRRRITEVGGSYRLDRLEEAAARDLLRSTAGRDDLGTDKEVQQLVARCHHLPLVLKLVGARLAGHPALRAIDIARELRWSTRLVNGDSKEGRAIQAALESTFKALIPAYRHSFYILAQHPTRVVDQFSGGAMVGGLPDQAAEMLEALFDEHILEEEAPGRYVAHDLLRDYAHTQLSRSETSQALARLVRYYGTSAMVHSGVEAVRRRALTRPDVHLPDLTDTEAERNWMATERAALMSSIGIAIELGLSREAVEIAVGVAPLLERTGPWGEARDLHRRVVKASARVDEPWLAAEALKHLGTMDQRLGDYDEALVELQGSVDLYRDAGDVSGQARTLMLIGSVLRRRPGQFPAARDAHLEAIRLFREIGDRSGEAYASNQMCVAYFMAGEYHLLDQLAERALALTVETSDVFSAAYAKSLRGLAQRMFGNLDFAGRLLQQSFDEYIVIDHRQGQAESINMLATVRILEGRYGDARQCIETAMDIHVSLENGTGVAQAHNYLGWLRLAMGRPQDAIVHLRDALVLQRSLGHGFALSEVTNNLGRAFLAVGRPEVAIMCHRRGLYLAGFIPVRLEQAHAHAGLAECHAVLGDRPLAHAHRDVADRTYAELEVAPVCRR